MWMDGWETRRHRAPDHDWCVVRLGAPGIIRGVVVDTAHFTGNFPEKCSLEASADQQEWTELLPHSGLLGDTQNTFEIDDPHRYTHLRFHIYPDGGVARLRVHGEVVPGTHWAISSIWPRSKTAAAWSKPAICFSVRGTI